MSKKSAHHSIGPTKQSAEVEGVPERCKEISDTNTYIGEDATCSSNPARSHLAVNETAPGKILVSTPTSQKKTRRYYQIWQLPCYRTGEYR